MRLSAAQIGRTAHGDGPLFVRHESFALQRVEEKTDGHGREAQPLGQLRRVNGAFGLQKLDDGASRLALAGLLCFLAHD